MNPAPPPRLRKRWLEITIIVSLMAFGGFTLLSKAGREQPIKFSDVSLPEQSRTILHLAEKNLQNADRKSLQLAKLGFAQIIERHPDYPPAHAQWALSETLLKYKFRDDFIQDEISQTIATQVLREFPDQKEALLVQAWPLSKQTGRLAERVLKQDRYNPFALYLLSKKASSEGKTKLALRYARTLALQNPSAPWLRQILCETTKAADQSKTANEACKWAEKSVPKE